MKGAEVPQLPIITPLLEFATALFNLATALVSLRQADKSAKPVQAVLVVNNYVVNNHIVIRAADNADPSTTFAPLTTLGMTRMFKGGLQRRNRRAGARGS